MPSTSCTDEFVSKSDGIKVDDGKATAHEPAWESWCDKCYKHGSGRRTEKQYLLIDFP